VQLDHQYEVTIVCHYPYRPFVITGGDPLSVYTIRGDFKTVAAALGVADSDARNQLDRFEATLNESDPSSSAG
jgi:hypothetical protein